MDEKKENDFWESSNDDFWNKPVMSDDWLKEDTGSIWGTQESDNFFQDDSSEVKNEEPEKPKQTETTNQNPYLQKNTTAAQNTLYTDASRYGNSYDTSKQVYAQVTGQAPKKKRVHVHTIICLCFIFLAIGSVAASVISVSKIKEDAASKISKVSFTEEDVDDSFWPNENNEVFLGDVAYTILSEESFTGFPKGQKLIAVSVEVLSDKYISGSRVLEDTYIGYTKEGMNFYKMNADRSMVRPYVVSAGFQDDQILYSYGIGNGTDEAGFFFFFVPDDVEKITFYAEQREEDGKILLLEKVYKKEMPVLPESQEVTEELTGREED